MSYQSIKITLMTFITGLLCFLAILLSTPWGAQLTVFVVNKVTPIHIEYKSGALLRALTLTQVSIENEQVRTQLNDLHLQLHLRCLWKKQLCVDELSVSALSVKVLDSEAKTTATVVNDIVIPPLPSLPFSLQIKHLALAQVHIDTPTIAINLTDFSTALSMNDTAIKIAQAKLATAGFIISEQKESSVSNTSAVTANNTNDTIWPLAALPKITIPFTLSIQPFTIKRLTVDTQVKNAADKTQLSLINTVARISWVQTKLTINQLSSTLVTVNDEAITDAISLSGKLNSLAPYQVDLAIKNSFKSSDAFPYFNETEQKLFLQGDLSQLAINASSDGAISFTSQNSINLTDANLPFAINLSVSQFILPNDIYQQIPLSISPSTFSLRSEGDLNQQVLNFKSEFSALGYQNVALNLAAEHQNNTIKIDTFTLQDLHDENDLSMTGELKLAEKIAWDIRVKSSGITIPEINQDISGRVQGSINSKGFWQDDEWALQVKNSVVKGEINQRKLTAKANIDMNQQGEVAPSDVLIEYGNTALTLNGYSDTQWHINGNVSVENTNLWVENISSQLSSKIAITGPIQQPVFSLQGQFTDLMMATLSSDNISFDVQYSPLDNHQHQVNVTSAAVSLTEHNVNTVNLSSHGDLTKQALNIAWLGDSSIDLLVNSQYLADKSQWSINTANTAFVFEEFDFTSNKPLALVYNEVDKSLLVNKHCWQINTSKLCLDDKATLSEKQGDLSLTTQIDAPLLNLFMPKDTAINSAVDGQINMTWQQGSLPIVAANLAISAGDFKANSLGTLYSLLTWQEGYLTFNLNNKELNQNNLNQNQNQSNQNKLNQEKLSHQKLTAQIGLTRLDGVEAIKASTVIKLPKTDYDLAKGVVASQITIQDFNLSALQAFVPDLAVVEGVLNSKVSVKGDLSSPIIDGNIAVTQGKTNISGDINNIEDINLALDFSGQKAVITGGLNVNKKPATITGRANWQDIFQADVNLDGESIMLSVPPDLTVTFSPHLNAKLTEKALNFSGNVEVLEGKLSVDKLPQGSVSLSKDVIIVNDEGEIAQTDTRFDISTNIRVIIKDVFKVEGQGFIGRLGGELQVSQHAHQPIQLFGGLVIPEGRYRAYGQDLSMTKGNISFNGPVNNPYVSMQATRSIEQEDVSVGVDVSGLANNLTVKLFSKPSMQQSEILSYLVRGRGLDVESSGGGAALGMALGTAVTNYSGILTELEKLPLVNRIEIEGDDQQASIAGYLGDKIYIKYGVGVVEPINELTVRFYILSRLWLETVASLESSASIYYSFDIK
ncbi:translocation/assembly module TamB domain-containing protein [Colwellia sp. E2M01]|uniref:translocation/assembly module TamB domain-containing protein n=1 Tax=Colwellia sp. E2M01 TaxID=2841561 RepID=UPI001C08D3E0|nr:translocation/assembly module TamB domain-containing protein [Colwellia sp. E2M01]MBU2871915.1 translocation/assembly module TamB domain-containing protein [Colwellia sp. E2M01]